MNNYLYKSAFVFGKFLPFHLGHKYLVDTALKYSEKVNVLVCSIKSEPIDGKLRYKWVKEIYKDEPRIIIKHSDKEAPQCPEDDPANFWDIWVNIARSNFPEMDVLFTSELYGDEYASKIGIKHHMVDINRINYPVSGTNVRNNTFKYWNYIPDNIKPYFVKRIAIMGPESTGKSTLSKILSAYYDTNYVEEYGRTVYENNGNKVTIDDFMPISIGRQEIEDRLILNSNKLIFCDTEDITTSFLSKEYCSDYKKVETYFIDKIQTSKKYDLYILLRPDCDYIQDGTRTFEERRWKHFNAIRDILDNMKLNYVEIGGNWENRTSESIKYIDNEYF